MHELEEVKTELPKALTPEQQVQQDLAQLLNMARMMYTNLYQTLDHLANMHQKKYKSVPYGLRKSFNSLQTSEKQFKVAMDPVVSKVFPPITAPPPPPLTTPNGALFEKLSLEDNKMTEEEWNAL